MSGATQRIDALDMLHAVVEGWGPLIQILAGLTRLRSGRDWVCVGEVLGSSGAICCMHGF